VAFVILSDVFHLNLCPLGLVQRDALEVLVAPTAYAALIDRCSRCWKAIKFKTFSRL